MDLQYSCISACISVAPQRMQFRSYTWKEHIMELCNGVWFLFFFSLKIEKLRKLKTCDMLHQDFYVYNFVLPQWLTVLYHTVVC